MRLRRVKPDKIALNSGRCRVYKGPMLNLVQIVGLLPLVILIAAIVICVRHGKKQGSAPQPATKRAEQRNVQDDEA